MHQLAILYIDSGGSQLVKPMNANHIINKETADGRKMQHYSDLLANAIDSIITVQEESDIESLFSVGETTALLSDVKGLDDFELITFLIIR